MASSENMATIDPWAFRQTFADPWLTKALQKSMADDSDHDVSKEMMMINTFYRPETTPVHTPTVSGCSENETAVLNRRNGSVVGVTGAKIKKRKSRASKRNTTTFITADPANFRHMVQQVTGAKFGVNGQLPVTPLLKPEPKRPVNRLQTGCLPTLDTSAILLDPINQLQRQVGPASGLVVQPRVSIGIDTPPPPTPPSAVVVDGGSAGFEFESFCNFPTLESWKVM